jgi:type VI secretion system protein ImpA
VRVHELAGLSDGFRLARELVERYWEQVYPLPEEGGTAGDRVYSLGGLSGEGAREGTLIAPINRLLITKPRNLDSYSFVDYRDAVELEKKGKGVKVPAGAVTLAKLRAAAADTPAEFYQDLVDNLTACKEEFSRLTAALDQRCGPDSPPSTGTHKVLEAFLDGVKDLAGARLKTGPAAPAAEAAPAEAAAATPGAPTPAVINLEAEVIRTREEAFRDLLRLAAYFRQTEPHGIISYALEQIVRWGRMSLPELLAELITKDDIRKDLFKQVGITPPAPPPK